MAALHTPGAHPAQRTFDTLQAAQGYAATGERKEALSLLDEATELIQRQIEPPPSLYWYRPSFFQMNVGAVHLALGKFGDAVDLLRTGLQGLPPEQRDADWTNEYRVALAAAER